VMLGNAESVAFSEWMVWMGMRWLEHRDVLVGMAWAFMEVHEALFEAGSDGVLLDGKSRQILKGIAARERKGLEVCKEEIYQDAQRTADFRKGVAIARKAIK
jgi:hypothetical protein